MMGCKNKSPNLPEIVGLHHTKIGGAIGLPHYGSLQASLSYSITSYNPIPPF